MSADDLVQFKVYIDSGLNDEEDREVRQFGIESGVATNFSYITEKLKSVFPCLENVNDLHIYWKDTENDKIRISTDTELIAALTQMEQEVKKLYVKLVASEVEGDAADDAQQQHEGVTENDNNDLPQLHEDIICDGCDGPIVGFRYKCLQCPNFDLCSTCEATGSHPQHYMLRMTKQANTGLKIKAFDAGEKRKWHFHLKGHGPFGHGGPFGHEHHKGPMMGAGFHHEHGHHKGPMMGPGFYHEHGHHKGPMMGPGFHHEHRHHKGPMMGPGFHHEHEHHKGPMMGHGFPPGRFCPYSKIHAMKHGKKHMKKHMKHLKKQFKAFC